MSDINVGVGASDALLLLTRSFEDVEERFLQPVVDAVEPVARLFVESQVRITCYNPIRSFLSHFFP